MSQTQSAGAWLYRQGKVSWLYRAELRNQLPWPYRLFAVYCRLQQPRESDQIKGGEKALKAAISLSKMLGLRSSMPLKLGKRTVFLNLHDPRMLQIPNELCSDKLKTTLGSYLSPGDTFVDVGANHGTFSILASELVGPSGTVVSIEPQPKLASLIERSLAVNGPCLYQVYSFACGDQDGEAVFYIPEETSGSAGVFFGFSATQKHRTISVPLKRFDEGVPWRKFTGKTFVKLDVEGSELAFLRGAQEMIRAYRPNILMEVNPVAIQAADIDFQALLGLLGSFGYEKYSDMEAKMGVKKLPELDSERFQNIIVMSPE